MAPEGPKPGRTRPQDPSGKPLLWVAAALVAAALAVLVLLLSPRGHTEAASSPVGGEESAPIPAQVVLPLGAAATQPLAEAPAPTAQRPAVPRPASSALPPLDLFQGESLELLKKGRDVTLRGAPLNTDRLKEIYKFGKEHPGDARPHLLMGADSMNRSWYGMAVDHYVRAQKEDARARQDPRMLADLVKLAGNQNYAAQSGAAIRDIYGAAGISPIEDAIAEAESKGDAGRVERLTALARTLSEPAPAH